MRRRILAAFALASVGLAVGLTTFVAQRVYLMEVGLGERVIDGERAVNLTGWDREGYDILAEKPNVAILEIGNANVTDETPELPKMESLRIARTKVTPEGIRRFLDAPPPRLGQIDVSGNGVPTAILRCWKNAAVDAGVERGCVTLSSTFGKRLSAVSAAPVFFARPARWRICRRPPGSLCGHRPRDRRSDLPLRERPRSGAEAALFLDRYRELLRR